MKRLTQLCMALAAAALFLGGCGGGDKTTGGTTLSPNATQSSLTADAVGSVDTVEQMYDAVDADLNSGSAGKVGAMAVGVINTTIDFADPGPTDPFPGITGQLGVLGTVNGTRGIGNVYHSLTLTCLTDVVITSPNGQRTYTIGAGSTTIRNSVVSWSLDSVTNDHVGVVTAHHSITNRVVTVHNAVTNNTVSLTVNADFTTTKTMTFSDNWQLLSVAPGGRTGSWSCVRTAGAATHSMTVTFNGNGTVGVTLDGITFGPFAEKDFRRIFGRDERRPHVPGGPATAMVLSKAKFAAAAMRVEGEVLKGIANEAFQAVANAAPGIVGATGTVTIDKTIDFDSPNDIANLTGTVRLQGQGTLDAVTRHAVFNSLTLTILNAVTATDAVSNNSATIPAGEVIVTSLNTSATGYVGDITVYVTQHFVLQDFNVSIHDAASNTTVLTGSDADMTVATQLTRTGGVWDASTVLDGTWTTNWITGMGMGMMNWSMGFQVVSLEGSEAWYFTFKNVVFGPYTRAGAASAAGIML